MTELGPWYTDDFDALSFHDTHIHGFHLDSFNSDEGCADLTFDMDYILKWEKDKEGSRFLFTLCRAELFVLALCRVIRSL